VNKERGGFSRLCDQPGHDLGGGLVGLGQQVGVVREHGPLVVPEPPGDDVQRDAVQEHERRGGVPEHVQRADREARRLPVRGEPAGEPLRVDRRPDLDALPSALDTKNES
jgi:hypothetical protein